jgi:hypothetical protein
MNSLIALFVAATEVKSNGCSSSLAASVAGVLGCTKNQVWSRSRFVAAARIPSETTHQTS